MKKLLFCIILFVSFIVQAQDKNFVITGNKQVHVSSTTGTDLILVNKKLQTPTSDTIVSTSKPKMPLSHNQYFLTYVNAVVGDIVGVIDPCYPTEDTSVSTITLSDILVDDEEGLYRAVSLSSNIEIKATPLTAGIDTVIFTHSLNGSASENDTAFITVLPTAKCKFINPSLGSGGSGTRANPYGSWSSVTLRKDTAYFMKRGSTQRSTLTIINSGTASQPIYIGAYGTGARPIFSTGLNDGIVLARDYVKIFEMHFQDCNYGLYLDNSISTYAEHCVFSDLSFNSNAKNGALYVKKSTSCGNNAFYHKMYDIQSYSGDEHGIKLEGDHIRIENARCYNNGASGLNIPSWGQYDTVMYISTYGNAQKGIELSGRYNEISFSSIRNEYRGIIVEDPVSYGSIIKNCYVSNTSGHGIYLSGYGQNNCGSLEIIASPARNFVIQDCEINASLGSGIAGIAVGYDMHNVVIQRNMIHNCTQGIYLASGTKYSVDSIYINHNVFYHNSTYDIYGLAADTVEIYNNTGDGSIYVTGIPYDSVWNCFYSNLYGGTSLTSLDIDLIDQNSYFEDAANNNYRLKSTAINAKDAGTNWQHLYDFLLNRKSGISWDIGAYEYQ